MAGSYMSCQKKNKHKLPPKPLIKVNYSKCISHIPISNTYIHISNTHTCGGFGGLAQNSLTALYSISKKTDRFQNYCSEKKRKQRKSVTT